MAGATTIRSRLWTWAPITLPAGAAMALIIILLGEPESGRYLAAAILAHDVVSRFKIRDQRRDSRHPETGEDS